MQDESKLAAQVVEEAGRAVVPVQREDDLAITATGEVVAVLGSAAGADGVVVVDLAVDGGVELAVFAVERLQASRGEVYD